MNTSKSKGMACQQPNIGLDSVPEGLTALEYARGILETTLGWPAKGNLELMADCLTSISKSKRLTLDKAYMYMVRAIRLAREQGKAVDRFFFQNGDYVHMRPDRDVNLYDREAQLREMWARHKCDSGWVYHKTGVVRCPACEAEQKRGTR